MATLFQYLTGYMLATVAVAAAAIWAVASEPAMPICLGLFSLAIVIPGLFLVGAIRGRKQVRTFCLGAMLPACSALPFVAEIVSAYRPSADSPFVKLLLIADLGFQRPIAVRWTVSLLAGLVCVLANRIFFRDAPDQTLDPTTPRPSRLQFSLQGFLMLVALLAVWLGVVVHRARVERDAIKAIKDLGGAVIYDCELKYAQSEKYGFSFSIHLDRPPPGPAWLRRLIGDEFFQDAEIVFLDPDVPAANQVKAIPHLQQLRMLRFVGISRDMSCAANAKFKASLPCCNRW